MPARKDRLSLIITRLAAVAAVLAGFSLPLGYALVSLDSTSDSLVFKAQVKAAALSDLIAGNPELWMFAENRIQGLISREPVALDNERVRVLDENDMLILESGPDLPGPVLARSYPLYDAGRAVGRLEIGASLRPLLFSTLLAGLLGLVLGAFVFVAMKILPLRALRRATNKLFEEKQRAQITLHAISDGVISTDARGHVQYLNPTAESLLGRRLDEVRGQALAEVVSLVDSTTRKPLESSLYRALNERCAVSCPDNVELLRPDRTALAIEERSAPIFDEEGKVVGGVMTLSDVSQMREYLRRRSWEADHDALTGLVNRRELQNRMQAATEDTRASGRSHVVCFLDLDNFKVVNDSCGHAAGDELLIRLSRLIQTRIRETDTLARLGGDEFALLLVGCETRRGELIAQEIMTAVRDFNFIWESKSFTVGASIGLATISADHLNVTEIVAEADCACYWAKEKGGNRVCIYQASDMDLAARRSEAGWVTRINAAFAENRFVLYHQTYRTLNLESGYNEHLEVLLRMIGEDGEIIAPGHFLPAAERYSLMPKIDCWVIHQVFSGYRRIVAQRGGQPLTCSINLSGSSINSEEVLAYIRQQAQQYQLGREAICFELTETVAVNNLEAAAGFIRECKEMGFAFALDDFGTGTSSFGYLKNLPVEYLKIDGEFVRNIESDGVNRAMTETINQIGHLLGKKTVAEFAENENIIEKLRVMGVDFAQGYGVCEPRPLFGPPAAAADS